MKLRQHVALPVAYGGVGGGMGCRHPSTPTVMMFLVEVSNHTLFSPLC